MSLRDDEIGGAAASTQLIAAARAGSASALNELLTTYRPYLLRIATMDFPQDLQGKVGASDLVQETLLHAAGNFNNFIGQSEAELLGWMRRILLNQMLNTVRHYRTTKRAAGRESPIDDLPLADAGGQSPSSAFIAGEEQLLVKIALLQLSPHYQQVIALRHEHDLAFGDIGQKLNCSEDAARKLWARAVGALQKELHVDE